MTNPLLQHWETPFGTPPFGQIEISHFRPAIDFAIRSASAEIISIAENSEPPDFENTIAALDKAGERLGEISSILFNLNIAETNSDLQAAAQEISPLLARFSNDITLNRKLFERVRSVYESRISKGFNQEQVMLIEKSYRNFLLGGAGLEEDKISRFREISEELSLLSIKFEENILEDTNSYELNLTDSDDLAGLPEGIIEMAAMEAKKRGKSGWIFTLHFPSYAPFMKYSEKRNLRETMYRAFTSRAFHNDIHDNREIAFRIANLRLEQAKLTGFSCYADLILGDRMAESTSGVESFLRELHSASYPTALRDFENLKNFAADKGYTGDIRRWDWSYWSEKLQKAKFDIDDEILKPYFRLESVEEAVFDLAATLYGIKFVPNNKIPVYHKEVQTWEVHDEDDSLLAILFLDYFPRPGKNNGAWMTSFREQRSAGGNEIRPIISIVANFTRPTETKPALLTFNEVITFLHEFGHSLHGMLTKCTYESLSGTNVARDFVELPSQFMENYAYEKEWLSLWARHYITGEKIPFEIINKIKELTTFNEGYACNRQLGFAFLDMAWHSITIPADANIIDFEAAALNLTELFAPVEGTCLSTSFGHIFGGGYAAGYYGYKWAEVLDADAFDLFKETGIFNRETANRFRRHILEKGGTDKPTKLYKQFRGKEPSLHAFLIRSGLTATD